MASLSLKMDKKPSKTLGRNLAAQPPVTEPVILAINASERTTAEKNRSGTAGPDKRRFLTEMRRRPEDARGNAHAAPPRLSSRTHNTTPSRAQEAGRLHIESTLDTRMDFDDLKR
jgi:hypothetical protein